MPAQPAHPEAPRAVILWLTTDQLALARQVCALAQMRPVGAGSPQRGQGSAVAAELETRHLDDLRAALAGEEARLFWLLAPGAFGAGDSEDAAALLAARARGAIITSLEPIPAAATDLASGWLSQSGPLRPADCAACGPRLRLSQPLRDAAEVLESFGDIRSAMVESWRRPSQGTLGAQVYDALDLLCALLGEPETVDAAYVGAGPGRARPPADSLRDFRGDLTASLRFADGRTASVVASDHAGRWNRTVTLLGQRGRLRIFDDGFEWIDPAGEKVDASRRSTREAPPKTTHDVAAMVDDITRRLDPAIPPPGPVDHRTVMSLCQATLLSARTGQCESPASIRQMTGA
ncbi:MAG: hypothetical protein ACF8R7_06320 [Phycisphaerales bacterium JB039]